MKNDLGECSLKVTCLHGHCSKNLVSNPVISRSLIQSIWNMIHENVGFQVVGTHFLIS